jgi:hypothetical protein
MTRAPDRNQKTGRFKKMKNVFARIGRTCAQVAMAGGLMAGVMLAGEVNQVTVTLPHEVTVGATTLPSGQYTISTVDMAGGDELFVVRSAGGPTVSLLAEKIDAQDHDGSQVVFSKDGDSWHFDKLFIQGDDTGYQFVNVK